MTESHTPDEPIIDMLFEFAESKELARDARRIQDELARLDMVKEVEATPEKMQMSGLEVAAAIGVTVVIVRGGTELVEEVRKLFGAIRGLIADLRVKNVSVDVGKERVPIDQVGPEQLQELAQGRKR